jgi:hypothetical protein
MPKFLPSQNGEWVKFDDIKEFLKTAPNNGSTPCCFFSREKIRTGVNENGQSHFESVPWCNHEATQRAIP